MHLIWFAILNFTYFALNMDLAIWVFSWQPGSCRFSLEGGFSGLPLFLFYSLSLAVHTRARSVAPQTVVSIDAREREREREEEEEEEDVSTNGNEEEGGWNGREREREREKRVWVVDMLQSYSLLLAAKVLCIQKSRTNQLCSLFITLGL